MTDTLDTLNWQNRYRTNLREAERLGAIGYANRKRREANMDRDQIIAEAAKTYRCTIKAATEATADLTDAELLQIYRPIAGAPRTMKITAAANMIRNTRR